MPERWIVVADGAQARILALERDPDRAPRAVLRLVESAHLSNPEHTVSGRRVKRKIKSGRDTGRGSVAPHGFTDHREPHDAESLRRFAHRVGQQAANLAADDKAVDIVLVAAPRMLGVLRAAFAPQAKAGAALHELARDYTWCTGPQLLRHLAENDLLSEPERVA